MKNGNVHKGINFKIRTQKSTYKMTVVMFEKVHLYVDIESECRMT